jgi:hypothetical protein
MTKSGVKQKISQNSDNRWGQAGPCVFEDLGGVGGFGQEHTGTGLATNLSIIILA